MNKCYFCKKKLKLYENNIKCECGHKYCMKHMNKHSHNCTFNSKSKNKEIIIKSNPKLNNNKITKI